MQVKNHHVEVFDKPRILVRGTLRASENFSDLMAF